VVTLRDYQTEAVESVFRYFGRASGNPLVVLPTGSGKSLVLASFVSAAISRYPSTRALVVTHRKELIEQDANALQSVGVPCGIYSAGLKRKEIRPVTVGGVQSLHGKNVGRFDLMIVDECHLVPQADGGMYRGVIGSLRDENPRLKIVGLTATPYRLNGGLLTHGKDKIFSSVAYEKPVRELVDAGYLSPLVAPPVATQIKTQGLRIVEGDFLTSDLERAADQDDLTRAALDEWQALASDRKSSIFFCVSVAHAENVTIALRMRGVAAEIVTGATDNDARKRAIERFRRRETKVLVSVDVLTTGFDAPCTDCIVLLRPTASTGLYVQIAGRGMRLYDGKRDCLVLDFGGNIDRHGPITHVRPKATASTASSGTKCCPQCLGEVASWRMECAECGFVFEPQPREIVHEKTASRASIMGAPAPTWVDVPFVRYDRHEKEGKPPSMVVAYEGNVKQIAREWVCFEHTGFAREKACRWWVLRGGAQPIPDTVDEAIERAESELLKIESIHVETDGKYQRIKDVKFAPLDNLPPPDEIPF
jgi:DNA repair protein RadD